MARVIDKISISIMAGGGSMRIAREQQNSRGRETVEAREGERGEDDFDASPSRQPCGVITRLAEHGGGSSGAFGSSSPLSSPRSFPLFNFSSLPFSLFLSLSPFRHPPSFFDLSSNFSSTRVSIEFPLPSFRLDREYDAHPRTNQERIRLYIFWSENKEEQQISGGVIDSSGVC